MINQSLGQAAAEITNYDGETSYTRLTISDEYGTRDLLSLLEDTGLEARSSLPTQLVANSMKFVLHYDTDANFAEAPFYQPHVHINCEAKNTTTDEEAVNEYVRISSTEPELNQLITFGDVLERGTYLIHDDARQYGMIYWQQSAEDAPQHSILMVQAISNYFDIQHWTVYGCTFDAIWTTVTINSTSGNPGIMSVRDDARSLRDMTSSNGTITITPEWANYITVLGFNATGWFTEVSMFTRIVALALSDLNPMPANNAEMGAVGKNHAKPHMSIVSDGEIVMWLRLYRAGYGYDSSGLPVRLSLAVLLAYCFIATSNLIYSLLTGRVGSSWDSIGDLLMLALNSRRPQRLSGTSAGADILSTYREPVAIRANGSDTIELLFTKGRDGDDDADADGGATYRRVTPNMAY